MIIYGIFCGKGDEKKNYGYYTKANDAKLKYEEVYLRIRRQFVKDELYILSIPVQETYIKGVI